MSYAVRPIAPSTTTTLVVFDARVTDLELLYNALLQGSIAHTISQTEDAIDVITNLLSETGATRLAIVAHGQPGSIQIGRESINRSVLQSRSGLLQEWGVAEIALYSCEVGVDAEFVQQFGALTGATIGAAIGPVGAGGTWELGEMLPLLDVDRLATYPGTLATFTGDPRRPDTANAVSGTLTGFTGGTVAELQDAIGDVFYGEDGDIIIAGSGDDVITGITQTGILVAGGAGNDHYILVDSAGLGIFTINETLGVGGGVDLITFPNRVYYGNTFYPINLDLRINGLQMVTTVIKINSLTLGNIENVISGVSNDIIHGNSGNNWLRGDEGDDELYGHGGTNILDGGNGNDSLHSESVTDTVIGGAGFDKVYFDYVALTSGVNVTWSVNPTTATNQAYPYQIGTATTGNVSDVEYFFFNGTNYADTVNATAFAAIAPPLGLPSNNNIIFGNGGNDTLLGSVLDDDFSGGIGNDYLSGGDGNDFLLGDDGNDTLYGGNGNDSLSGGAGSDTAYGEAGTDAMYGYSGDDFLYGGDGVDTIYGGDGVDRIEGGNGDDFLYGGNYFTNSGPSRLGLK